MQWNDNTMAQSSPTPMAAEGISQFIIGITVVAFFKRGIKTLKSIQEPCLCNLRMGDIINGACALALVFLRKIFSAFLGEKWTPWLHLGKHLIQEVCSEGFPALGSPLYH